LKLVSNPEKCTGCRICEIICSLSKEKVINPSKSRIQVVTVYPGIVDTTTVCRQCEHPPCVPSCPVGAISKDQRTEAVIVDASKCIGCGRCKASCPYNAIAMRVFAGRTVAIVCDLCGGEPACVRWCPFAAIEANVKNA
jgi:carbon-monoxide dehydrogenase iron sulfur subunit